MKFSCEKCFYYTDSNYCFEKHKISKTHIQKDNNVFDKNYQCTNCNKFYKSKSGFYSHKKKCEYNKELKQEKVINDEDIRQIVIDLYKQNNAIIKENAEMKNMLIELSKKDIGNNIITNNNIENNNSNKFDINIFLNEKCKHAIDLSSLIESIVIRIQDIENIAKDGYVKTITDIVTEKLQCYSMFERPLHFFIENQHNKEESNDTIHIRDNGQWLIEDMGEHDVLLSNMNALNGAFLEKTENTPVNQTIKEGRRYNRTGKIITNILDKVKLSEEQLC